MVSLVLVDKVWHNDVRTCRSAQLPILLNSSDILTIVGGNDHTNNIRRHVGSITLNATSASADLGFASIESIRALVLAFPSITRLNCRVDACLLLPPYAASSPCVFPPSITDLHVWIGCQPSCAHSSLSLHDQFNVSHRWVSHVSAIPRLESLYANFRIIGTNDASQRAVHAGTALSPLFRKMSLQHLEVDYQARGVPANVSQTYHMRIVQALPSLTSWTSRICNSAIHLQRMFVPAAPLTLRLREMRIPGALVTSEMGMLVAVLMPQLATFECGVLLDPRIIVHMPSLTTLKCAGGSNAVVLTDGEFAWISKHIVLAVASCVHLTDLDIAACNVDSSELTQMLTPLSALTRLKLGDIAKIDSLRFIMESGINATIASMTITKSKPKLDIEQLAQLEHMPTLTTLRMSGVFSTTIEQSTRDEMNYNHTAFKRGRFPLMTSCEMMD